MLNKYTRTYFAIIAKAKTQARIKGANYYESHHIIPKSLGGSNELDNKVLLTFREHFICHQLLVKMVDSKESINKMRYALYMFSRTNLQQRGLNRRQQILCAEANRAASSTRSHYSMLGKKHSEESKAKMRDASLKQTHTQATRDKISQCNQITNPARSKAISKALTGQPKSIEHRARIAEATRLSWIKRRQTAH